MAKRKKNPPSNLHRGWSDGATRPEGHPGPGRGAQSWELYCDAATFDKLRADPAFHRLLELARHVNALRYGISASAAVIGDDTPNGNRQRFGTFFYLGGVLFEAFQLVPKLRRHFEGHSSWNDGFAKYGTDEAIRARLKQGGDLHRLRNHTSFHFLEIVAQQSLAKLRLDEYTFTTGFGPQNGFVHHPLADAVGLHYLAGSPSDGEVFGNEAERIVTETRDLALEYISYGSKILGEGLLQCGFRRRGSIRRRTT